MRERTTWHREEVMKRVAALSKKADPYTMNQDHKQPKADQYTNGDPSSWGEDVHPAAKSWEAEYKDGEVKRDEIGMAEMRPDTFDHKEKTASEEVLLRKANLCVKVARLVLHNASESVIEDQALAFMAFSDQALMETHDRLAADKEVKKEEVVEKAEEMPAQEQAPEEVKAEEPKAEEAPKQASEPYMSSQDMMAAMQQQLAQMVEQAMQKMMQQMPAQAPKVEEAPVEAKCEEQEVTAGEDDIDQMLAAGSDSPDMEECDIEMDAPMMDTGDDQLGEEDDVLRDLFSTEESEAAKEMMEPKKAFVRTASTRTVGTKPAGVSRLGGVGGTSKSNDVDRLAGLWNSAPDVSKVFGR